MKRKDCTDEKELGRLCLSLDMYLIEEIKILAIRKRVSVSYLVEEILKKGLSRAKKIEAKEKK